MFPENVKSTFGLGFATGMTFMDIIRLLMTYLESGEEKRK
jgi:hypothetical protein